MVRCIATGAAILPELIVCSKSSSKAIKVHGKKRSTRYIHQTFKLRQMQADELWSGLVTRVRCGVGIDLICHFVRIDVIDQ